MNKAFSKIDNTSFKVILFIFILVLIFFALLYWQLSSSNNGIEYANSGKNNIDFLDALYFSTVTISSLGYGDIHPQGISKLLSSLQVLIGLLFLGILIAKITSSKMNYLLSRVYSNDLHEKIESVCESIKEITNEYETFKKVYKGIKGIGLEYEERLMGSKSQNIHEEIVSIISGISRYLAHEIKNGFFEKLINPTSQKRLLKDLNKLFVVLHSNQLNKVFENKANNRKLRNTANATENICDFFENSDDENLKKNINELRRKIKKLRSTLAQFLIA